MSTDQSNRYPSNNMEMQRCMLHMESQEACEKSCSGGKVCSYNSSTQCWECEFPEIEMPKDICYLSNIACINTVKWASCQNKGDGDNTCYLPTKCDTGRKLLTITGAQGNITGYSCDCIFSSESACKEIKNVQSCQNSNGCWVRQKCKPGYYHSNGVACIKGNVEHCTDLRGPSDCYACESGYTLKNNKCEKCTYSTESECKSGGNASSCSKNSNGCWIPQKCKPGYYGNSSWYEGNVSGYVCKEGNVEHCTDLRGPSDCYACESGYTLKNNKCLKNSVSGNCPSGLSKSADGCCCVK